MNKKILVVLSFVVLTFGSNIIYAGSDVEFLGFKVVLPPSVINSTAGYGTIKNNGHSAITLVKISSDAGMVMLHQTKISSGFAKMMHLDSFTIQPGTSLELKPLSFHLMFTGIDHSIIRKDGTVTLSFEFEGSKKTDIIVPVVFDQ